MPQVSRSKTLQIAGALIYVKFLVREGKTSVDKSNGDFTEAWVYYPDLQIAGRVMDILDILKNLGVRTIPIGEKFKMIRRAEQMSEKTFLTWADMGGSIDLTSPDAVVQFYNNSFDPFATVASHGEAPSGYLYNINGGQDSEVIKILFSRPVEM